MGMSKSQTACTVCISRTSLVATGPVGDVTAGSGVLSKRADLRWRRTPEDLTQLVGLQDELLDAAAGLVAPGGVLVYSTCGYRAPRVRLSFIAVSQGRLLDCSCIMLGVGSGSTRLCYLYVESG